MVVAACLNACLASQPHSSDGKLLPRRNHRCAHVHTSLCVCDFMHTLRKMNLTRHLVFSHQKLDPSPSLLLSGSCDSTVPASEDVSSHPVKVFTEMWLYLPFLARRI